MTDETTSDWPLEVRASRDFQPRKWSEGYLNLNARWVRGARFRGPKAAARRVVVESAGGPRPARRRIGDCGWISALTSPPAVAGRPRRSPRAHAKRARAKGNARRSWPFGGGFGGGLGPRPCLARSLALANVASAFALALADRRRRAAAEEDIVCTDEVLLHPDPQSTLAPRQRRSPLRQSRVLVRPAPKAATAQRDPRDVREIVARAQPRTRLPVTGLPASPLPATGLPAMGLPANERRSGTRAHLVVASDGSLVIVGPTPTPPPVVVSADERRRLRPALRRRRNEGSSASRDRARHAGDLCAAQCPSAARTTAMAPAMLPCTSWPGRCSTR